MTDKKEALGAIQVARDSIAESDTKKKGRNTFSNYDYFTPEQITDLVNKSCKDAGLMTTFSLPRDEHGVFGILTVWHLETGQSVEFKMAAAIPVIKATNEMQQLGGTMTYAERYLKMTVFGIVENDLDPDSKDHTQKSSSKTSTKPTSKLTDKKLAELPKEFEKFENGADIIIEGTQYSILKGVSYKKDPKGVPYFGLKDEKDKVNFYSEKYPAALQLVQQYLRNEVDVNDLPF